MTDFRELTNRILIPLEKIYRGFKGFRACQIATKISAKSKIRVVMRHKILFIRLNKG